MSLLHPLSDLRMIPSMRWKPSWTMRNVRRRAKRAQKGFVTKYLIKWKGYDHLHNSWEPEKNLVHCKDILAEYWTRVNAMSSR